MSGRTAGSRSGGGRGRDNFRKPSNNLKAGMKKKKSIDDYYFYIGSSKQASDYEMTVEFVINYIKKTFTQGNDIAESLRTLQITDTTEWEPILQISEAVNVIDQERENRQNEIKYRSRLDVISRRSDIYQENLFKAYAVIWERCAKAMQDKLCSRPDYEQTIYNNPIELLKAIKLHALNYQETRYEMSIMANAVRALINAKQKEGESLQDYTSRFKTARNILESHIGGPIIFTKYVMTMKEYDPSNIDKQTN